MEKKEARRAADMAHLLDEVSRLNDVVSRLSGCTEGSSKEAPGCNRAKDHSRKRSRVDEHHVDNVLTTEDIYSPHKQAKRHDVHAVQYSAATRNENVE